MSDTTTREDLAIKYGQDATHAALFSADPGALGGAGSNELASAGYARQALTWTAGSSDGIVTASATFTIAASTAVAYAGTMSAVSGGRLIDKVTAVYNSQPSSGQVTVNFTFTQT